MHTSESQEQRIESFQALMRIVRRRCRDAISESFQPLAEAANQMCESPSLDGEVDAEGGGWGEDLGVVLWRENVLKQP